MERKTIMEGGLILEGGAMRGLFTVLMENGSCFDGLIGVSAGAAFGCNHKSGVRSLFLEWIDDCKNIC